MNFPVCAQSSFPIDQKIQFIGFFHQRKLKWSETSFEQYKLEISKRSWKSSESRLASAIRGSQLNCPTAGIVAFDGTVGDYIEIAAR